MRIIIILIYFTNYKRLELPIKASKENVKKNDIV